MKTCLTFTGAAALAAALALTAGSPAAQQPAADDALMTRARAIHDKALTIDTHVDISTHNFAAECNYTRDVGTQVNLPTMTAGGLDAAFFIVYTGQGPLTPEGYAAAYKEASAKFDAIHRLTKEIAPSQIELALTSADARRLHKEGRRIAFIGVENGYSLGDDTTAMTRVKEFHDRGARYLSLAHNGHSQLADSNTGDATGEWLHKGLSPLGRQVVAELNRVGIMIDISHPSKQANLQTMALSKAPVIASHSSSRAMWNHSRNLDDEELAALKANGGVVQAVAFAGYVKVNPPSSERTAAQNAVRKEFGLPEGAALGGRGGGGRGATRAGATPCPVPPPPAGAATSRGRQGGAGRGNNPLAQLTDEQRTALQAKLAEVDAKFPPPARASVKDFVDHIDYLVKKIGIDHVGISSDFDGGGGVNGWNDAAETLNVTVELVRRGYTDAQIEQMWSGNLLRVLDQVQKVAAAGRQ